MNSSNVIICIILLVAVLPPSSTTAADLLQVDTLLDLEYADNPQISPDGKHIVYTRNWVNRLEDRWESSIWIMAADGGKNRFLIDGSSPQWSPDGSRIAYLAEGDPKGTQIFVLWLDAANPTQITRVDKATQNMRWSPNGQSIAFVMRTGKADEWEIEMPAPPEGATWTEPPRVIEGVTFRQDRRGFMKPGYNHIFVVDAGGGTPRQLTSGKWNVGARFSGLEFGAGLDWTPDGKTIVFDGLMDSKGDQYQKSHIYAVDVATLETRDLTFHEGPWRGPKVSPDGKWVTFSGHPWTPQTYHADDIYAISIDGEDMQSLTPNLDRDPGNIFWAPNSKGVYFTAGDRGSWNVYYAPLGKGGVKAITQGAQVLSLSSMSDKGLGVGAMRKPHLPGDIFSVDLKSGKNLRQLTQVNADILSGIQLGEVEEVWYDSIDSTAIQGWIVKPPQFDPEQSYPLVLHIHGGPHYMYHVGFNYSFQYLAASGYVVLYTNPRGSTGYGTDFGNAIDNAYPSVDYDDLMTGVDEVLGSGYIDPTRLYCTGVSGGGVLSSWIIGHNDRFAAAAVRAPVIDWISFAGTTDITEWGYYRYEGFPWEDPTAWLAHSPLMYVGNVTTPTLLMTGELDLRTPMGQTEEYFQALNAVGVETKLIRFNEEYHGTGSKPSNAMRTQLYLVSWFGEHVRE